MAHSLPNSFLPVIPPGEDELPYEDGECMDSERHRKQMNLLVSSLDHHWADRSDVYVGGDMFVYFSELQTKKNDFRGPDVFVVLNTMRRQRKSWVVWQEERTPDVVIELPSPSTEHVDRGEKMRIYSRILRVPEYYLYEPESATFEAYRLDVPSSAYVAVDRQPTDDCPSEVLGLQLGVRGGTYEQLDGSWLRWLDANGQILPSEEEKFAQASRKVQAAQDEAQAAKDEAQVAKNEARSLTERLAAYERTFGPLGK